MGECVYLRQVCSHHYIPLQLTTCFAMFQFGCSQPLLLADDISYTRMFAQCSVDIPEKWRGPCELSDHGAVYL